MRGRLFQYQALASPLPTDAETPEVTKWLPQMEPGRRRPPFRNHSFTVAPVAPVEAVVEAAVESWLFRQDRPVRRLNQRFLGWFVWPDFFESGLGPGVAVPLPPLRITIGYPDRIAVALGYPDRHRVTIWPDTQVPPETTLRLIRATDLTIQARFAAPRVTTDWTVSFTVRDRLGGTAVITKTVGSGITAVSGGFDVAIAKANTASLDPTQQLDDDEGYVWDLKRTNEGSNVVLARGQLILDREVTA